MLIWTNNLVTSPKREPLGRQTAYTLTVKVSVITVGQDDNPRTLGYARLPHVTVHFYCRLFIKNFGLKWALSGLMLVRLVVESHLPA